MVLAVLGRVACTQMSLVMSAGAGGVVRLKQEFCSLCFWSSNHTAKARAWDSGHVLVS